MATGPMVLLTTVGGTFHGRVLKARLGSEGIPAELRGAVDGPYPVVGPVEVYVRSDQVNLAREVLLADAVDAAFESTDRELSDSEPSYSEDYPGDAGDSVRPRRARAAVVVMLVALLVVVAVVTTVRLA